MQKQRVGSIYTSCYSKAVNSATCSCCIKQSCSQVLNTLILHTVHTPTQLSFSSHSCLPQLRLLMRLDWGRAQVSWVAELCSDPPSWKSNTVPGQVRSPVLPGREVVTKEGEKARCRVLWYLPLRSLRTGGQKRSPVSDCFQFATTGVHYFALICSDVKWTPQFRSLIHGMKYKNVVSSPNLEKDYFLPSSRNLFLCSLEMDPNLEKKKPRSEAASGVLHPCIQF